jgi:hypothetical protein
MRWSLIVGGVCLGVAYLLPTQSIEAAVLTGRVVDSAGQPVAGAVVRIWQKLPRADGSGTTNQPVNFGEGDALVTDAEGRFTSPDVLAGNAFARIVAETKGTLAGRSAWIEIPPGATVVAPNIVLKRLRAVIGQVLDRKGQPVAGAVVFNSGDAHERVQTKTGRNGKFFLEGVPEGGVFLFVEKAGYRFTGMRLPAGQSEAAFTLAGVDETVEPLTSLPPPLSADEETALAREVLEGWREELRRAATDEQKFFLLAAEAGLDPLEALKGIEALGIQAPGLRAVCSDILLEIASARSAEFPAEKLRAAIESSGAPFAVATHYANAVGNLPDRERPRRLAWLEAALIHARRVDGEALRMQAVALVADAFFLIGEHKRSEALLAEAESVAKVLPETRPSLRADGVLAMAVARVDPERAVEWLDKMKGHYDYPRRGVELAVRLLPGRPELAEQIWDRSDASKYMPDSPDLIPLPLHPKMYMPDFCHRLALIDLVRAERIALSAERAVLRVRGKGAIALAVAEKLPAQARKRLETVVRNELPSISVDDDLLFHRWGSPSVTAAWLLPIAERVAPDLCRELFWRSLALRLPRPRDDDFDDQKEITDLQLAKMLARYDRDTARALVAPFAARAVQLTSGGGTELTTPAATLVAGVATRWARELTIAGACVDPPWTRSLLGDIPYGRAASKLHPIDFARLAFVWVLARHGGDRWSEANEVDAGFWQPRIGDE